MGKELNILTYEQEIKKLILFVDTKYERPTKKEIFQAFDALLYVFLLLIFVSFAITVVVLTNTFLSWLPLSISFVALSISIASFMVGSTSIVEKSLIHLITKKIFNLLPKEQQIEKNKILMYPLIAIKYKKHAIKLQTIYDQSPKFFSVDNLIKDFYSL